VKRSRILLVLALLPFAAVKLSTGCSAQGEGQLCSQLNNNTAANTSDDCQTGLVCGPNNVCCPPSGSTDPACEGSSNNPDAGTGAGGSGGSSGTGGSGGGDAGSDGSAATDASSDGGSDGGSTDGGEDGGMSSDAADAAG